METTTATYIGVAAVALGVSPEFVGFIILWFLLMWAVNRRRKRRRRRKQEHAASLLQSPESLAGASPSPTPILDRIIPLPTPGRRSGGSQAVLVVSVVVGGVLGFALAAGTIPIAAAGHFLRREFPAVFTGDISGVGLILMLLALWLSLYAVVIVHELGHVLAGLCAGFKFNQVRVGPFQIDRPFRLSFYRGGAMGGGGWSRMLPTSTDNLPRRLMTKIAGGPAASLLGGFAVFLLPFEKGYFSFWFAALSILTGLLNLIPLRTGAFHSDGARILMLLQNRARADRWLAQIKLGQEIRAGTPPENLSPELLSRVTALKDDSPDTVAAYAVAYAAATRRGEIEKGAEFLETSLAYSRFTAPPVQHALMCDAGVFQARRRKRIDLARLWLAALPPKTQPPWLRAAVEGAILEARGDIASASGKLDEMEKLMRAVKNQVTREMSLRSLARWRAELAPAAETPR